MGNCYSLYSKNLGMSGKMVWWSTEPNWSTKLGDLLECLKLTLTPFIYISKKVTRYGFKKIARGGKVAFWRQTKS